MPSWRPSTSSPQTRAPTTASDSRQIGRLEAVGQSRELQPLDHPPLCCPPRELIATRELELPQHAGDMRLDRPARIGSS
jgi:hypothetical protein